MKNRLHIGGWIVLLTLLASVGATAAAPPAVLPAPSPYSMGQAVAIRTPLDRVLAASWRKNNLTPPRRASDSVMVRRLYLGLAGRLPTVRQARDYVDSTAPDKRERLIEELLSGEDFAAYWTMHWCDALRVKSEFPINLWPNAVYGYQRRIGAFLRNNEPYDAFVRALLNSAGSNFRTPEVNFHRAAADRSPQGLAKTALLTFLNLRWESLPPEEQAKWTNAFSSVAFKPTREWKEEIVYFTAAEGAVGRRALTEEIIRHPDFSRAAANRVWFWFFGEELSGRAECEELLALLSREFMDSHYNFRHLCRIVAGCAANAATTEAYDQYPVRRKTFAVYPVRRLDAEVLDDALRDLSGVPSVYSSVIPEPFSFPPPEARTVTLADGSINSSFLLLFGRPARDSGQLEERDNAISAKQRLYLFNSGEVFRRVRRIPGREELRNFRFSKKIDQFYWMFFSRPPTRNEKKNILAALKTLPPGRERWIFQQNLCWILLNTKEFLYQH